MKSPLIEALLKPGNYPHATQHIILKETHISWVILTGEFAYKIKKPVDFSFLDYTSLEKRHHFCQEEIRLNHRLAPSLYVEVIPIYGTPEKPKFAGPGEIIEYAIKMRQFDPTQQFDEALARNELSDEDIDSAAVTLADFHQRALPADANSPYGTPAQVDEPIKQNFEQMLPLLDDAMLVNKLNTISDWSATQHAQLKPFLKQRRDVENKIRECHGDFHLANITRFQDKITIFDCIEFNEPFRFTDTMADVGFLVMDLLDKHRPDLAYRFLSTYMESSDDYHGLLVLRYYVVYRAMVRMKINLFRLQQATEGSPERIACQDNVDRLLKLSLKLIEPPQQQIIMMHGYSGSGKTSLSDDILHLGMIRIRSDIIRKHIHAEDIPKENGVGKGMYTQDMILKTYHGLMEKARVILTAGFPVIIDATFLKHEQRECFRHISEELGVPWIIIDCRVSHHVLVERIQERLKTSSVSEATVDVLKYQEEQHDALTEQERQHTIIYDQENSDGVINQLHNYMFMQAALIE